MMKTECSSRAKRGCVESGQTRRTVALLLFLLVTSVLAGLSNAEAVTSVAITRTSGPTPNPALVNETVQTGFSATVTDPPQPQYYYITTG
jgi:hypothetical protein